MINEVYSLNQETFYRRKEMLISFSVENWLSFRDRATFSMVASREKQHLDRVPRIKKYNMRLLPIAAIYGGNASGKTNFFAALSFARHLVVKGIQPEAMMHIFIILIR